MADTLDVLTICGSLRKGSYNRSLLRALPALAPADLALRDAPPYDGMPHYNWDLQNGSGFPQSVTAWSDAIRAADGLIIVSPEYNWGIPGPLKNAIDWASRLKDQPFKGKPVALLSAATGLLGGARMQYQLRHVLTPLDAHLFGRPEVIVTFAAQKFDEAGNLKDEPTREMIKQQLAGFAAYARKLGGKS
jgi:chromate reductase, NAD(P)H dehydrogenase (quinone)